MWGGRGLRGPPFFYNPGMSTATKIIVLTGATRGLGRSLVPLFAAAGHTVVGCGRSRRSVEELAAGFAAPHAFAAVDCALAVPVCKGAAGLFEDREQRGGVPDLHDRIDHRFGAARRDQEIAVGVAPGPRDAGEGLQPLEGVVPPVGVEEIDLRGEKQAVPKRGFGRNSSGDGRLATAGIPGAAIDRPPYHLIQRRHVDDSDNALPLVLDADERGIQGHAAREALGAVDGIENPAKSACAFDLAQFFAQNRIVGKVLGDALSQERLGAAIGRGDGRRVGLALDHEVRPLKILQRQIAGLAGNRSSESQASVDGVVGRHRRAGR